MPLGQVINIVESPGEQAPEEGEGNVYLIGLRGKRERQPNLFRA